MPPDFSNGQCQKYDKTLHILACERRRISGSFQPEAATGIGMRSRAIYISHTQSFALQVILSTKHFIVTDSRHTKCSTEAWVPYEKCVGQTACLH